MERNIKNGYQENKLLLRLMIIQYQAIILLIV